MNKKVLELKFNKAITIYAFTDTHIGAKSHDAAKFKRAIDALKKDPNAYCFFNGDNVEFIPPGYYIAEGGQSSSVDEQIEGFIKLLKELGKKVLFVRCGNHEARAMTLCGLDIAKHLSWET